MNDLGATEKFFSEKQKYDENANEGSASYGEQQDLTDEMPSDEQLGSASLNYLENNVGVNNHYIISEDIHQTSH